LLQNMDIAHLIQTSVAPVFLLSGVAATLGVLTNRLARAVDRARSIEDRLENHTGDPEHLIYDLEVLARRARYLNAAISLCVVSAVMVALVVVTLFANAFFAAGLALTIALLFVGAMLLLTGAFVAFFIEVRVATAALRIGLRRAGA
jgi:VIT1/CCC1 family predicted Fe2+/Mn2+ transporter